MFTEKDLQELELKEIPIEKANWQIEQFKKGVAPIKLSKPATVGDGILKLDNIDEYIETFDKTEAHMVKFVPASGAASRMFKDLFEFKDKVARKPDLSLSEYPEIKKFFANIKKFAFYHKLNELFEKEGGVDRLLNAKKYDTILSKLLTEDGLRYGSLPKGLLAFHLYAGGVFRTPFEEHLKEGAKYAVSSGNKVHLHFTVSPEHLSEFEALKEKTVTNYEEMFKVKYSISFSVQKSSTDTLAVTPENKPFYNNGAILFRPGGHGALIENLNEIDADIIFIKNIDNVLPEKRLTNTIRYKKALAGYLFMVQQKVFSLIKTLKVTPTEEKIKEATELLEKTFNQDGHCTASDSNGRLTEMIIDRLNRPIRVCGVVKNLGEPGGGPFIVKDENGCFSPQIVESSQVDFKNKEQDGIFKGSTHFNPVDLVCAVRNFKGEKFELSKYIDESTCFISQKSKGGKALKALELPGLWNGAMAEWNTVFIEVPVETFNPVKTVNDLLRDAHQ